MENKNQILGASLPPEKIEENLARLHPVYTEPRNGIEVYIFTGDKFPELLKEIGRLREVTFRSAGSGSGKPHDIDHYDTDFPCYRQIIVYSRKLKKIISGCRCFCPSLESREFHHRPEVLASSSLFSMSEDFIANYLPYTLDVGRTIIVPELQTQTLAETEFNNRSPLEYVWKGFGYLVEHFDIRYFFGRVVIYEKLDSRARNLLYHYLETHFAAFDLVCPKTPIVHKPIDHPFRADHSFKTDLTKLNFLVKEEGKSISPLIRAYVQLSPTLKFFGSAFDADLSDVEEMAVFITLKDIYPKRYERFRFKKP